MSQGDDRYYNLNSLWMDYQYDAEYEFGVTYHNAYSAYFEDYQNNYQGNKNLYAMYLPSACRKLVTSLPTSFLSLPTSWRTTDLSYTFTLYQDEHCTWSSKQPQLLPFIVFRHGVLRPSLWLTPLWYCNGGHFN